MLITIIQMQSLMKKNVKDNLIKAGSSVQWMSVVGEKVIFLTLV